MRRISFSRFAWGLLFYNLAVIVWGAFVRASFSGDGCGAHWPNCGATLIPALQQKPQVIEFLHRASSGIVLILAAVLFCWALRRYPRNHPVRMAALASFLFTISEALVGAVLVLYKLVAHNPSAYRALAISLHLTNTFLLLGALTLTAWWASGNAPIRLSRQGALGYALLLAFIGTLILGVSGAITALGDMLFPAASLLQGLHDDLSPTAHFLVRLRLFHPLIATSVGLYLLLISGLASHLRPSENSRRFARLMAIAFLCEMAAGIVNYLLKAPVWMQLVHLLFADAVWIILVLVTASALADNVLHVETTEGTPEFNRQRDALGAATWRDYIALTKPRVISLLLFTTLAAMFIARPGFVTANGWHGAALLLAVAIGGYMAAGAANAVNMVIDRDIDGRMKRTSTRPTVTQKIPSASALWFAFGLAGGSFALLWAAANLLAAMLALAGLVFYVIVYTMLLKRRTWHNIVIGGAAGAFPPLVGWAAVTGNLSVMAWYLFAIIFVWTPVHFWALALLLKDDYASVGIPMLPVVRGDRATVVQIGAYAVLTAIVSILPFFVRHEMGPFYLCAALLLNATLLLQSLRLYQKIERPRASSLFHYSMVYLALLFLVMAVDRAIHI
jgi:heme o synthase